MSERPSLLPLTRRKLLTAGAASSAALLAATLTGCAPITARIKKPVRVDFGYLPITDAAPLCAAHRLGYFKDEGIESVPHLVRTWASLAELVIAGKAALAHFLFPMPLWMRFIKNQPIKALCWNHTGGSALTVRSDLVDKGLAGLGGKVVAIPYWLSTHNVLLQLMLGAVELRPMIIRRGARPGKGETGLTVLPPPEMLPALKAGQIDGFIVAEPFGALAELAGIGAVLRFTGDVWKDHPCCIAAINENLLPANSDTAYAVVRAICRAQQWLDANPAAAPALLAGDGDGRLPMPAAALHRVFSVYGCQSYSCGASGIIRHPEWTGGRIDFTAWPHPSATRFMASSLKSTLMDSMFDVSAIDPDEAAAELFELGPITAALDNKPPPDRAEVFNV